MPGKGFSSDILNRNLRALSEVAPEVACWLEVEGEIDATLLPPAPSARPVEIIDAKASAPAAVTVVVGGGLLDEVKALVRGMEPGHQVFVMEPRAKLLTQALGRHDLAEMLSEQELVLLPPSEAGLEGVLSRHPQLGLADKITIKHLYPMNGDFLAEAAAARLYRMLGQAMSAREFALDWEGHCGDNLIANLGHAAFMGRHREMVGYLSGRPALLVAGGPTMPEAIQWLKGRLGKVALFATDRALGHLLDQGIIPTAAGTSEPMIGPLAGLSHPDLTKVPLLAEEVAHAPTLMQHPGPLFLCLGPRGTGFAPFQELAGKLSPQHHSITRLAEMAVLAGCRPLILVGVDLTSDDGPLSAPSMTGQTVHTTLEQAATARSLGRVLSQQRILVYHTSPNGLGLPGCKLTTLKEAMTPVVAAGGPLRIPALDRERWLTAPELNGYAQGLMEASAKASRLWQRAAAPASDFPSLDDAGARNWLAAADRLFVALAEQAAADSLQAAFLDACLVRAFRRRYRLMCQGRGQHLTVMQVCRGLVNCLADMQNRAAQLAQGLRENAQRVLLLSRALEQGDWVMVHEFAAALGHEPPRRG